VRCDAAESGIANDMMRNGTKRVVA